MSLEFDVYASDAPNALTPFVTLEEAIDKSCLIPLNKPGFGQFSLPRDSDQATEEFIAKGNLVKVRLSDVLEDPITAFWLETGSFDLVSSKESGGELLTFGGRSTLSILNRGVMWDEAFLFGEPGPVDGVWQLWNVNNGPKAGSILRSVLQELGTGGRPVGIFPDGNIDFTYTHDTDGILWAATPATAEYTARVGDPVDSVVADLVAKAYPMVVEVTPDLIIRAYNNFGVDRSSTTFDYDKVRLQKGVNIATDLSRQIGGSVLRSSCLVAGDPGFYGHATLPLILPAREVFITAAGVDTAALDALAVQELDRRMADAEAIRVVIPYGDDPLVDGLYKPDPTGTLGHYWIGDTITVHTGAGAHDYNNSPQRIVEIAIGEDEAGNPVVEAALGSTYSQTESSRIRDFIFDVREGHVGPHR